MNTLTLEQKERLLASWPYPWPELLHLAQVIRDERLNRMDDPGTERSIILSEYADRMNRYCGEN